MQLEKFEQEFTAEITQLKKLKAQPVVAPYFKIPSYGVVYKKAMSIAFAIPAFAFVFAFFFYVGENNKMNSELAQLEASNNRIINQINSLDYENNI